MSFILAFYFQREDGSVEGRAYTPRLVGMASLVGSRGLGGPRQPEFAGVEQTVC